MIAAVRSTALDFTSLLAALRARGSGVELAASPETANVDDPEDVSGHWISIELDGALMRCAKR